MSARRANGDKGGFTLIELLIALAIGSVVMAGAVGMFRSQRVAFDLLNQMKVMEENGRVGMDLLSREVRKAGGGGTPILPIDNADATYAARQAALGAKAGTDILEIFTGVLREPVCLPYLTVVADGNFHVPASAFTGLQYWDPAANTMKSWTAGANPGNDVTVLSAYSVLIYSKVNLTINCAKRIIPATIGSGPVTTWFGYTGGNTNDNVGGGPQNCAASIAATDTCFNIGTDIYYYVDTNNQLIRSVVGLQGAARVNEVIASYVEDFQVKYAQDGTAGAADNLIQAGDWRDGVSDISKVRMVKISLLMKSKNVDPNKAAALAPILENSAVAFGAADKYRRRVFTRTVRLRNMEVN